ncbi:MAG: CRISPR-associated helicase Cas3' [Atribacterota bacterium]
MRKLISHPTGPKTKEKLLFDHLLNVAQMSYDKICKDELDLSLFDKKIITNLVFTIGLLHDFGKSTSFFQDYIRLPDDKKRAYPLKQYKNHSVLSAIIAFYIIKEKFDNILLAYLAFHVIYRHHGDLVDFDLSRNKKIYSNNILKKQIDNICNFTAIKSFYSQFDIPILLIKDISLSEFEKLLVDTDFFIEDNIKKKDEKIEYFLLTNYIFSLLIESDKADASRINEDYYFSGNLKEKLYDIEEYIEKCRHENPHKYDTNKDINKLRSSFLSEIAQNKDIQAENHLYTLTAPTGIGKTFACLKFAEILKDKINKENTNIIYCLPYTSIIDQNYDVFKEILMLKLKEKYSKRPQRYLLKHHYLTKKDLENRIQEDKTYSNYLDDILLIESWRPAIIVTTFVQLFHSIFSNKNRNLKKFHNIVNSIVILDEVQNIDPDYYFLIREVFEIFAERFNTYFLLMTATQPYIFREERKIELVSNKKYQTNKIFNRTNIEIDLEESDLETFKNKFLDDFKGNNALIVMNTRNAAVELFRELQNKCTDYKCYCLTNYLIPRDKEIKIKEIGKEISAGEKIIVISTQLIEAGVDLSFKNVFRDLAPLDSVIQVAGRCNRSCEYGILGGRMYLFNLDNNKIYNRVAISLVKDLLSDKRSIKNSDFSQLSSEYYQSLNVSCKSKEILKSIYNLNYDTDIQGQIPVSNFNLIDNHYQINIYIFPSKNDQKIMNTFLEVKDKLIRENYNEKKGKDSLLLQIENLKNELKQYQISLFENDLKSYKEFIQPEQEFKVNKYYPYLYISHEHLKYDPDIGFQKKTQEEQLKDRFY